MDPLTSTPIEHKKLGIKAVLHDFSQEQYERYHQALFISDAKTMAAKNGAVVSAAIHAGILTGLAVEQIPGMKPAAVIWLDGRVHEHVLKVITPPKDDEEKN